MSERSDSLRCLRCGSAGFATGRVDSTGRTYFRPNDSKFLRLATTNVALDARMCLDCGTVELVGDVEKARYLTRSE